MADIDINPFGDHNKTEQPTWKTIPFTLGGAIGGGGFIWEPEDEQETSFGGKTQQHH